MDAFMGELSELAQRYGLADIDTCGCCPELYFRFGDCTVRVSDPVLLLSEADGWEIDG